MIKHSKKLYENGTTTSYALKTEEFLSPESKENLRGAWQRANTGISNSAKVAILDGGIDLQNISMPLKDTNLSKPCRFGIQRNSVNFQCSTSHVRRFSGLKYSNISTSSYVISSGMFTTNSYDDSTRIYVQTLNS